MQSTQSNCPPWVERLFFRLQVRYGSAWNLMWEGIEPDAVKADWEEALRDVFTRSPHAISNALANLPDRPPTVDVFMRLCRQAARPAVVALPPPEPEDPKRVKEALSAMSATKASLQSKSMAQQCIDNIERIVGDGRLSSAQKHMISHCLNMPGTATRYDIKAARAVLDRVRDGDKSVSEPEITESLQATGDMRNPYSSDPRFAAWEAGS